MPVFTDSMLIGEVMRRAERPLSDRVLFAPVMWLGNSEHHLDFPGTMSASPRELRARRSMDRYRSSCRARPGERAATSSKDSRDRLNVMHGVTAVAVSNTFNGANGQVFRTVNGGTNWTNITANLPAIPTWSAKIDTDTNHTMYLSNEIGVYSAASPYTSWAPVGSGLPHAQGVQPGIEL